MTRLIKKYKNRRLYDTDLSQYITIERLKDYVVRGIPFRVENASSHKDITNAVLLQIMVEMESGTTRFLSEEMLRQLIVLADHPLNQSFKNMLQQLFSTMEKSMETNPYLKNYQQATDRWTQQMDDFVKQWQGFFNR